MSFEPRGITFYHVITSFSHFLKSAGKDILPLGAKGKGKREILKGKEKGDEGKGRGRMEKDKFE